MRSTAVLAVLLILIGPGASAGSTPLTTGPLPDLAAASRRLHAAQKDLGAPANIYLLADRADRLERRVSETLTEIENTVAMVPYLAGTDYGPAQVSEQLLSFMGGIEGLREVLQKLDSDAQAALRAAQPATGALFPAQALKTRALTLRTHLEALKANAEALEQAVEVHKDKLKPEAAPLAAKLATDTGLLAGAGDALVTTADLLLRKAQ